MGKKAAEEEEEKEEVPLEPPNPLGDFPPVDPPGVAKLRARLAEIEAEYFERYGYVYCLGTRMRAQRRSCMRPPQQRLCKRRPSEAGHGDYRYKLNGRTGVVPVEEWPAGLMPSRAVRNMSPVYSVPVQKCRKRATRLYHWHLARLDDKGDERWGQRAERREHSHSRVEENNRAALIGCVRACRT